MASIETLISQISDPTLRAKLAREFAELKRRRPWGLVFERHLPEAVRLLNAPIRQGSIVWERRSKKPRRFVVRQVDADVLTVVEAPEGASFAADAPTEVLPRADVLVEHDLSTPIYPTLTRIDEVRNGPAGQAAHAVIQGENHHALEALLVSHARSFDVTYLDPPYNTGDWDWAYNNDYVDPSDTYRPSKWLAFMERRLRLARKLLRPDGVLIITIDEHEVHHLGMLLEQLFPDALLEMASIVINPSGTSSDGLSRVDEYAFFLFFGGALPNPTSDDRFSDTTKKSSVRWWDGFLRGGAGAVREARKNLCYPVFIDSDGRIAGAGDRFDGDDEATRPLTQDGYDLAWPVRKSGELGIWRLEAERLREMVKKGYAYASSRDVERGTWSIKYLLGGAVKAIEQGDLVVEGRGAHGEVLITPKEGSEVVVKTVWNRRQHTAGGAYGTQLVTAFLGRAGVFSYPKSLYSIRDAIDVAAGDRKDALILDFFGGSGTTLHATMLMNAEDGAARRCVLVTNNEVNFEAAGKLNDKGKFRGDSEFDTKGVFEAATKPRLTAAVTGVLPDGKPVEGQYLDGRSFAEGFAENVAFFRLDYLDPDEVEFGMRFTELHPLLWLWAGGIGEMEDIDPTRPLGMPAGSPYAVLFDPSGMPSLMGHLEERPDITHVFIVAESDDAFEQLASDLLAYDVETICLYRDYLTPLRQVTR